MKSLLLLACALSLAACGGPSGKADQIVSKKATRPSWDAAANPIEGGLLYHQDDGLKLGINIIVYSPIRSR